MRGSLATATLIHYSKLRVSAIGCRQNEVWDVGSATAALELPKARPHTRYMAVIG